MMTDIPNSELINAIKEKLPEGTNLANTLMDYLHLGKEATYRRLRGDVPFTLTEAATLSQKFGISLDKLAGAVSDTNAIFNLNLVQHDDPVETYYSIVKNYTELFTMLVEYPESELSTSSNIIPQTFYLKYDALSRFRLFKWMYQHEKIDCLKHYEDLELPSKLLEKQKEFVAISQLFKRTSYVWDKEIFPRIVTDIKYFSSIQLISEESVRILKDELFKLLDELEEIASKGKFTTENEIQIYISNINFEATYSYVETPHFHIALIRVFAINSITSRDEKIFHNLKEWIQSLKKFSTLVSQSGEIQRIQFFNAQRKIVDTL
ncbi:MAG: hypothetical protein PUB21_05130 [Bacteroidales bacterium]|nr:hypothetical protein [Bacteroidales bacterium]